MFDLPLLTSILLLVITVVASILYYKHIRGLREKYEEARNVVGDIVLSFNNQLQGNEERLDAISNKTEVLSASHEKTMGEVKEHKKVLEKLATAADTYSGIEQKFSAQILSMNGRIESMASAQERITEKIAEVEKLGQKISRAPKEEKVHIEAPIPIKREKALAPLTETELRVLKILADDGQKTAPEIRELIELTREHTARLMKKLYEEGYLERSQQKLPYSYRIKKEMLKILRKQA